MHLYTLFTKWHFFVMVSVYQKFDHENGLIQGWAISDLRATCGPPQRFQLLSQAFRKNLQIGKLVELITINVSAEANLNRDLLLITLEGTALR